MAQSSKDPCLWELILRWLNSITNCVSKFPGLSSHLKLSLKSLCLLPLSLSLSAAWPQPRGSSLSWAQVPGPAPVTRGSITSRGPSTISCSRPGVWTVAGCRFLTRREPLMQEQWGEARVKSIKSQVEHTLGK